MLFQQDQQQSKEIEILFDTFKPESNTFVNSLQEQYRTKGFLSTKQIKYLKENVDRYVKLFERVNTARPFKLKDSFAAQVDDYGSLSFKQQEILDKYQS